MTTQFLAVQNNATGTLLASMTSVQGTATLDSGQGNNFPAAGPFHISIDDEIMRVDSRAGDVLTVTRAQEGTAGAGHNAASAVELRVTAKHISDLETAVNTLEAASHGQDHNHQNAADGGVLTDDLHDGHSEYAEIATPGTPPANKVRVYAKDSGTVSKLFYKGDDGVEVGPLAGAGGTPDASAVTYTPSTPANWAGAADPGNVDGALNQLAARPFEFYISFGSTVESVGP